MTETQIIKAAAGAFHRRDKAAQKLQEIDNEIKGLVKEYSLMMKVWGYTPTMLRQAVVARLGIAA
jgi:UDP-galactopyranose mutase